MGRYYSLEFITKTENLLKLLQAFSKRLSEGDRERFKDFDLYEPAYEETISDNCGNKSTIKHGLKFINIGEFEDKNYYCFSLVSEIDEGIINNFPGYKKYIENNKLSIGCAWTSLYVGENNVLLKVDAASTNISLIFEESKNIHKLCSDIAEEVGNTKVYLDKEEYLYLQIFPENKEFIKQDIDISSNDKLISTFNVDAYVKEVENLADKDLC